MLPSMLLPLQPIVLLPPPTNSLVPVLATVVSLLSLLLYSSVFALATVGSPGSKLHQLDVAVHALVVVPQFGR